MPKCASCASSTASTLNRGFEGHFEQRPENPDDDRATPGIARVGAEEHIYETDLALEENSMSCWAPPER